MCMFMCAHAAHVCVCTSTCLPYVCNRMIIGCRSFNDHMIYLTFRFDEYASHGWSLSHQPVDMLTNLKQYHMSSITEQIKASSNDAEVCKRAITLIQYLCGLIR